LVGDEAIGGQHHQAYDSKRSGVYVLVGQNTVHFFHLVGVSVICKITKRTWLGIADLNSIPNYHGPLPKQLT